MSRPERCACPALQEALQEGVVIAHPWAHGPEEGVVYLLPHPSGDEDKTCLMLFCPFCGQAVGDGLAFRVERGAGN